ncbi:hypothetical protein Gorai_002582 [Gossypium raimondii]|uniref:CCHC-type domain-containing protein n=1 Tax=Gossypium raimondii TaxID=29730 RepID=A0A7J8QMN7_GOSRA|nr:hypothetical protein [Gossypium raimondii]
MASLSVSLNEDGKDEGCKTNDVDSNVVMAVDMDPNPPQEHRVRHSSKQSLALWKSVQPFKLTDIANDKPLVSKVLINGILQRIENEYLPIVCFSCGCYGHVKEMCLMKEKSLDLEVREKSSDLVVGENSVGGDYPSTTVVVDDGNIEDSRVYGP